MGNPKWLIFIFSVWIIVAILGGIIEGAYFGGGEAGIFNTLTNLPLFSDEGSFTGKAVATFFSADSWGALFSILTFDFAFFSGATEIFRWVFFMPFALSILISFGFFLLSHIPIIGRGGSG